MQGIGLFMQEEVSFDQFGSLINDGTWEVCKKNGKGKEMQCY